LNSKLSKERNAMEEERVPNPELTKEPN
jgi:hypothetical protein